MTTFITQALQRLPWLISAYEGVKDIFGGDKEPKKESASPTSTTAKEISWYKRGQNLAKTVSDNRGLMQGIGSFLRDWGEGRTDKEGGIGKSLARAAGEVFGAGPSDDYKEKIRGERSLQQYKDYMGAYMPVKQQDFEHQQRMLGLAHMAYGGNIANMPFRYMAGIPGGMGGDPFRSSAAGVSNLGSAVDAPIMQASGKKYQLEAF
jgi:hypothetical protein